MYGVVDWTAQLWQEHIGKIASLPIGKFWVLQQDTKGLYIKTLGGNIFHFTGISEVYEMPVHSDGLVKTDRRLPEVCVGMIIQKFVALQDLSPIVIQNFSHEEVTPYRGHPSSAS